MKPIPDNIKEILGQLQGPQQVALKAYIGTLRAELKDLEAELHALQHPAPANAHYHGTELCTADHGHSEHAHGDHKKEHAHDHKEHSAHEHKEHDHKHSEHCDHKDHDHKGHDHKEHDHKEHDHKEHDHKEHDHKEHDHKGHDHKGHHEHEHKKHHGHDHKEVPAWKKKAMESDPAEAPFGGSWNTESSANAKHDGKMHE